MNNMGKKHLVYAVLVLIAIIGIQTYYIQHIQQQYLDEELSLKLERYQSNQSERDSLLNAKMNDIIGSDFKIEKHFYNTKEIIKQNEEELQKESDDNLSVILDSLIRKRKRASKLRSGKGD